MPSRYESLVSAARPNDAHGIALQLVGTGKRVLELGAANGHVTKELIARGNSVVAVEIDEDLRPELSAVTDTVIIANLDHLDLIDRVSAEQFDVVLAGDVLEHTIHTRLILEEIRQLLKPGGYLVISVPNIAHGDVRLALLNGEFRYRDVGILDRTHRTFFTRDTLIEFLTANGFTNLEVFASTTPVGTTEIQPNLAEVPSAAIDLVLRDPLSSVYQYIVKALPIEYSTDPRPTGRRNDSVGPASRALYEGALSARDQSINQLKMQLESSQEAHNMMETAISKLAEDVAQLTLKSRGEDLELRDYALGVLAELGEARAQLLHTEAALGAATREIEHATERLAKEMTRAYQAEKELVRLRAVELRLAAVYGSYTWRLGRFFMLPIRVLRRLLRR